jgi:hypothetical protein
MRSIVRSIIQSDIKKNNNNKKRDLYLLVIILEDLIAYRGGIINLKIGLI